MSSKAMEEVDQLLEKMVQEKILSLDGVKGLQLLKDKLAQAETSLEVANNTIKAKDEAIQVRIIESNKLSEALRVLKEQLDKWQSRENELAGRERKIFEHEKAAAVEGAKAEALRYAMETVFKPAILRESVWKGSTRGEVVNQNGYNTIQTVNDNETVTRESRSE